MKIKWLVLSIIALVILGPFTSSAQGKLNSNETYIIIDNYLVKGATNGFSGAILVSKEGELIINKGYGLVNEDINTINNPNTIFDTDSNTKQFTSAAILRLDEQKKLHVTDSISKYFNELPIDKQNLTRIKKQFS